MFVNPEDRGKGISLKILKRIESLGRRREFQKLHFETGKKYPKPSHCTRKWLRHNLKLRTIRNRTIASVLVINFCIKKRFINIMEPFSFISNFFL
jgi:hypothetical protein